MNKTAAFVGSHYSVRPILILGESTWDIPDEMTDADYVRHWIDHPKFSKYWDTCATCHRLGKARHPGEGGGTPTREERKAAWQAVCAAAQLHRSP